MTSTLIETDRLIIRAFTLEDTFTIHRIFETNFDPTIVENSEGLAERRSYVEWSALSHEWFPKMQQAPYGDRAIELKSTGELIGSVGYVALLMPFEQIPGVGSGTRSDYYSPEFGMFWTIDPAHQRQGYATEAVQAMIGYAFRELHLKRIVATTQYMNVASQGVMKKVGMTLIPNPLSEPHWLQVVGVLENGGLPTDKENG